MRSSIFAALLLATTAAGGAVAYAQQAPAPAGQTPENPLAKASVGPIHPASGDHAQIGDFGIDLAGMDKSVDPGDDFYAYANGTWQKQATIPGDQSSYGMFNALNDLSLDRTRAILDTARQQSDSKIGAFYASFMDEAAADRKGAAPIKPWLAAIAGAKDRTALATEMGKLERNGVGNIFDIGVNQDDKNPENYIVGVSQSGLGLPDRDYYLNHDAKLDQIRTAYKAYIAKMLTLAGMDNADARAAAIYNFEKQLATVHWTRVDSRDADKTYNKWSAADFAAKAPGFPWDAYRQTTGLTGQQAYLVAQPSAITGEAKVYAATPLAVLKDAMAMHVLRNYAGYLSTPFEDANFAFYGTTLSGTPDQRPRWKRGVSLVQGMMGEAIGKIYVAKYFPPEAKAAADDLVKNIIAAMNRRIDKLEWMAPETKQKAHAKLAAFRPKIGYPDKWRDYSSLQIEQGDLVGNVARANAFEYQRNLNKLGKPLDRGEWFMTPMTINAYANPTMDEIVFPAAILQPPFFDPNADPAVNYGGIGAVIGHEMSHHFDDQGRKYDAAGKLTDWWTPADVKQFTAFTNGLVKQYDTYEPIPGTHIKGALTLGENIADLAGLTVAHDAYEHSLGGKKAPVLDGFTGDQRFYLGWAQVWRIKYRPESLARQLVVDPHSPGAQRTATVRNLAPWYAAYNIKPSDDMYLAPNARVKIW